MQAMTFRNVSGGESEEPSNGIGDYIDEPNMTVNDENNDKDKLVTVSIPTKNKPGYTITVMWNNGQTRLTSSPCNETRYVTEKFSINTGNENKSKITIIVKNSAGEEVAKATYEIQKDENGNLTIAKENNS